MKPMINVEQIIKQEILKEYRQMLPDFVIYKNRPYKILWRGITKDGRWMSKLKFINGDKEFWVFTSQTQDGPIINSSAKQNS